MWVRSGPRRRAARGSFWSVCVCVCVWCTYSDYETPVCDWPPKVRRLGPGLAIHPTQELGCHPARGGLRGHLRDLRGACHDRPARPSREETPCLPFFATRAQIFLEFLSGSDQRPRDLECPASEVRTRTCRESESESESERARGLDQAVRSLSQHPHHPPRFAVPRPKPSPPSTTLGG